MSLILFLSIRVGGLCHKDHACVIGELGVTTSTGKPYPSAGFTAVYVMAHEIGHNLGMSHDHSVSTVFLLHVINIKSYLFFFLQISKKFMIII